MRTLTRHVLLAALLLLLIFAPISSVLGQELPNPEFKTAEIEDRLCINFSTNPLSAVPSDHLTDLCHGQVDEYVLAAEPLYSNLGAANRLELVITYAFIKHTGWIIYPNEELILFIWRRPVTGGWEEIEYLTFPEPLPGTFAISLEGFDEQTQSALFTLLGSYRPIASIDYESVGCFFSVNVKGELDLSHCRSVFQEVQGFNPVAETTEGISNILARLCRNAESQFLQGICSGDTASQLRDRGSQTLDSISTRLHEAATRIRGLAEEICLDASSQIISALCQGQMGASLKEQSRQALEELGNFWRDLRR